MPKEIEFADSINNTSALENALGLEKGSVLMMAREAGRTVKIVLADKVPWPDDILKNKLEKILGEVKAVNKI